MSAATSPDDPAGDLRPHYDFGQLRWRQGRGRDFAKYAAAAKAASLDLSEPDGERPTSGLLDPEQEAKQRMFRAKLEQLWRPRAVASTRPIWSWKGKRLELAGTGTLFRVADSAFLVTASHVVEQSQRDGSELILPASENGAQDTLKLSGTCVGHRTLDVVVWELPEHITTALNPGDLLGRYQVDRRNRRAGVGLYAIHGYPREYCDQVGDGDPPRIVRDYYTAVTGLYRGGTQYVPGYDPSRHLLIGLDGYGLEPDGSPRLTPHLDGMSGCSIWQVYAQGIRTDLWTPDFAVVVAVQTHANRKLGYIRGTRWWVVDRLIREGWPHLGPALSLEVPDPPAPAAV